MSTPVDTPPPDRASGGAAPGPPAASLEELEEGQCGLVTEVLAGVAEMEQLMAMGVCGGRRVMKLRGGDPLILMVLGSRIGLSARLARRVRVEPCQGDMFGGR